MAEQIITRIQDIPGVDPSDPFGFESLEAALNSDNISLELLIDDQDRVVLWINHGERREGLGILPPESMAVGSFIEVAYGYSPGVEVVTAIEDSGLTRTRTLLWARYTANSPKNSTVVEVRGDIALVENVWTNINAPVHVAVVGDYSVS